MTSWLDRIFGAFQWLDPGPARCLSLIAVLHSSSFLPNHSMEVCPQPAPISALPHVPLSAWRLRVTQQKTIQYP
jgi:hypothetical protein